MTTCPDCDRLGESDDPTPVRRWILDRDEAAHLGLPAEVKLCRQHWERRDNVDPTD